MFLSDSSKIQNSNLDKIYSFSNSTNVNVKVDEWLYNENDNLMVVKLNVSDITENYNFDLNFEAVAKTQINKSLDLKIGYKSQNDYYLIIENIPQKYDVISLRVKHISKIDNKENEIHSTIENFMDEKLISFNIKSLKDFSKEIFNAQLFNILNLLWDNLIKVGSKMKSLYENGQIAFEDIERFLISVDEAHLLVNTNNPLILDFFTDFARQSRKYFGGFILVYHDILDMVPEGSSNEQVDEIKKLFALIQYKFLMKQDSSSINSLLNVFKNELTTNEANMIPRFTKGDCILIGASSNNIHFNVDVSEEELAIFKGGM